MAMSGTDTETVDETENDLEAAMGLTPTQPETTEDPVDESPADRRKRKKRETYAAKKAAEELAAAAELPASTPDEPAAELPTRRLTAGARCPKCSRGVIGVVRTRLQRTKNKRTRILGCRNFNCLWDLDGDDVRVTPINAGKPIKE
jgi:hypothetical protein